ncbi:type II toxin-antitoxin system HicA family toxin [Stratiformator vulcanicus]|uniref:type II toxin-antitoxin system HicA family toxin n=1 Tax=Stratiformator vulcanicus TaxID=2527980 RepID=UPI00119D521E
MQKHRKMLHSIFEEPVKSNLAWRDIESMLKWLGSDVREGRGSRVRVALNGVRAVFHRPHPAPEASRAQIRSVRRFLIEAGVDQYR